MAIRTEAPAPLPRLSWRLIFGFVFVDVVFLAVVVALIFLAASYSQAGHSETNDSTSDAKAIRQELDNQVAAWNRGDLNGFMETYWHDDRLVFYSGGDITTGWTNMRDRYDKRYRSEGKVMGRIEFPTPDIVMAGPTDALVRGRFVHELGPNNTQKGLYSLLMRKIDGTWRIVHDHTSVAVPDPGRKTG